MNHKYFSELLPALADRATLSSIGNLAFANVPLQRHLFEVFNRSYGEAGAYLADPTFEAVFGWKQHESTMAELAGDLLSPSLVRAMDSPPEELAKDYRFAEDQHPYVHQVEAWEKLSEKTPKSLVVASGTGSGKTECFMVPILDSLVREKEQVKTKLVGVRALFLYPLNALINSQRDRFRAWTHAFGGDIRFCLYNGNTPETQPAHLQRANPNEVIDRKSLRQSPPSLLVTNATMLEYMLVRTDDAPILAQSQGKLQWVVLDEAHTYVGSQAAEAALLIRRVLLGFGVKPEQVRFIATSATIGDPEGEAGQKLKNFLAEVAGVNRENVFLVAGQREIPRLINEQNELNTSLTELENFQAGDEVNGDLFNQLVKNSTARRIRHLFVGNPQKPPVAKLSEVSRIIHGHEKPFSLPQSNETARWLDVLSLAREKSAKENEKGQSFLPLRAHLFHQTLSGIWACADVHCPLKQGTDLEDEEWEFGTVYFEPRKHCDCQSPAYEVIKCDACGTVHLRAERDKSGRLVHLQSLNAPDEFELDSDEDEQELTDENENPENSANQSQGQVLIVSQKVKSFDIYQLEKETRKIVGSDENAITVRLFESGGDKLICPVCEESEKNTEQLFRPGRVGAPFFIGGILPTLLEFAEDADKKPEDLPFRGRRLLSFNDSRQGTARMAARLQQDAERNRIRGLIYHLTLNEGDKGKVEQIEEVRRNIKNLEDTIQNNESLRGTLAGSIEMLRAQLTELIKPTAISFNTLVGYLTQSGPDFVRMLRRYNQYSANTFPIETGSTSLAQMFLIREFGRRPKRQNNLETMGMVALRYPALDKIEEVPAIVRQIAGFDLTEWRNFLKICLDFDVRANGSLEFNPDWRNWLGIPFPQKFLVSRDSPKADNQRRWMRAERSGLQSKIVRLLVHILNVDIKTTAGEDAIDLILGEAWDALTQKGLLKNSGSGFLIHHNQIEFMPIETAWICPITRRFLDTTLRGVTPYLPRKISGKNIQCEMVTIPLYDKPFSGVTDDLEGIKIGREWLHRKTEIIDFRNQGLWSASNDRVIELSPYFVTGEHSAQQDSATLQQYEKSFKNGTLNLLSCSTTMEMGIDIGGISIVSMNNVPPHPANYLQRAGRAGRRREARSLAVTVCKSNPHDQSVFSNTRWAFDSVLPAPSVSLDSSIIVQRHLNSFLLARFFKERFAGTNLESTKLNCGMFFNEENLISAESFCAWCRNFGFNISDEELKTSLTQLVKHSILENTNHAQILECAAKDLEQIAENWRREWQQLEAEQEELRRDGGEKSPAFLAVEIHKRRLSEEYLLRELATRGFLPGYGFPTNIAAFDNMTAGRYARIKQNLDKNRREDNRFRRRELASRDVTIALREYAPGSEVVMDGLVYVSAGVTLNWHIPADSEEAREIQNICWAWRCGKCGSSGSSHSLSSALSCLYCGSKINRNNIREFIEPAGFAVDFYQEPSNDVSKQKFVPVEPSWIDADGVDWFPLTNPALGRFRLTTKGHIFNQSRGVFGNGYALCLQCGRAEPMPRVIDENAAPEENLPKVFQSAHRKLRRNKNEGGICPGSFDNWKIKQEITLGHESRTDIFELQLKNIAGIWLNDETTARTVAVVLRDALAESLGVQAGELGCEIKPARTEDNQNCQSILIYDRFAAGYASSADRFFPELFRKAADQLNCPANCDSICPHCVLDYDQRFAADSLDRFAAASFLTEEWLNSLRLPAELAFFGESSCLEHRNFTESLLLAVSKSNLSRVRFYAFGKAEDWDIAPSPLREAAYKLAGRNVEVEIMMEKTTLESLVENDRYLLASLADNPLINLRELDFSPNIENGWILAEAFGGNTFQWAVPQADSLNFDADWGKTDILIKTGSGNSFATVGQIFEAAAIRPQMIESGDKVLEITHGLDGTLTDFGKDFWAFIKANHPAIENLLNNKGEKLVSVSYTDRYLYSPLTLALLYQIVEGLKSVVGTERTVNFDFELTTAPKDNHNSYYTQGNLVRNDWLDSNVRDRIACLMFNSSEQSFTLHNKTKKQMIHGRQMILKFSGGDELTIRFDQGVSYWMLAWAARRELVVFDFNASEAEQCDKIKRLNIEVTGNDLPTQIYLSLN